MHSLDPGIPGRWNGVVARFFAFLAAAAIAGSVIAEPLFPQPLHITRVIEDPIAGTSITVEEYCAGDQVVSVAGERVTIVDYVKHEMTEIDRAAGTWSVARFDEIAKAMAMDAPTSQRRVVADAEASLQPDSPWVSRSLPARASWRGRTVNAFELTPPQEGAERMRLEIAVDPDVRLSKPALEALIGASFPHPRRDEHDAILRAAGAGHSGSRRVKNDALTTPEFGLPVEQILSVEFEGRTLALRNIVRDVKTELPPELIRRIPPGARQVEPRAILMVREAHAIDSPASAPSDRP